MTVEAIAAFESIGSSQDYFGLLAQALHESQQSVEAGIQREGGSKSPCQLEALRLIGYGSEKLASHIKSSWCILNDLNIECRILQQSENGDGGLNECRA